MTTDRLTDVQRRIRTGRDSLADTDERSMRILELILAIALIAVVVLMAVVRA